MLVHRLASCLPTHVHSSSVGGLGNCVGDFEDNQLSCFCTSGGGAVVTCVVKTASLAASVGIAVVTCVDNLNLPP